MNSALTASACAIPRAKAAPIATMIERLAKPVMSNGWLRTKVVVLQAAVGLCIRRFTWVFHTWIDDRFGPYRPAGYGPHAKNATVFDVLAAVRVVQRNAALGEFVKLRSAARARPVRLPTPSHTGPWRHPCGRVATGCLARGPAIIRSAAPRSPSTPAAIKARPFATVSGDPAYAWELKAEPSRCAQGPAASVSCAVTVPSSRPSGQNRVVAEYRRLMRENARPPVNLDGPSVYFLTGFCMHPSCPQPRRAALRKGSATPFMHGAVPNASSTLAV